MHLCRFRCFQRVQIWVLPASSDALAGKTGFSALTVIVRYPYNGFVRAKLWSFAPQWVSHVFKTLVRVAELLNTSNLKVWTKTMLPHQLGNNNLKNHPVYVVESIHLILKLYWRQSYLQKSHQNHKHHMQRIETAVAADETHCITWQGHRADTKIHVFTSIAIVTSVKLMNVADLDVKRMKVTLVSEAWFLCCDGK